MALPDDIITKVRQDFSEDDSLRALQILKELVAEDSNLFEDRMLRCLVVLADGHIEQLVKAIVSARGDFRDVINAAESQTGNSVSLLSMPFGVYPDLKIFKQWFVGRKVCVPWADNLEWTVEFSDIRDLSVERVRQLKDVKDVNPRVSDPNLYLALLNFLCIRGDKEISASRAIEGKIYIYYRLHPETGEFEFKKFYYRSQDIGKRGKW